MRETRRVEQVPLQTHHSRLNDQSARKRDTCIGNGGTRRRGSGTRARAHVHHYHWPLLHQPFLPLAIASSTIHTTPEPSRRL
ncbi:hypothetical protein BDV98DRAFT_574995 [Pterulicium gracile]|uniref:Uncharacterized protein n=1 Tax=Pterulicium gracile TaxID=1884261 RepID=A0A5C3Q6J5_9AGAR|nr:hypothetical protein BDV98DRAFT_574995 [Pterula gracilis]